MGGVQGHGKVLCTLGGEHSGVVNRDGAGRPSPGGRASPSRLSLRWWADIQAEISARHAECVLQPGCQKRTRKKVVERHYSDRRDDVRI